MDALLSLIPGGTLTAIVAAVVAVLGVIWRAFVAGKKSEQAKQVRRQLDAIREKKEIDHEVDNLGPADVDQRFERYRR